MKRLLIVLLATLGLGGTLGTTFGTAAQAATYTVGVTADPFRMAGAPGLQTRAWVLSPSGAQHFGGSTLSFDLTNPGDSFSTNIFGLVTFETAANADDLTVSPSTATFDFGFAVMTILGSTHGVIDQTDTGVAAAALATFIDGYVAIGGGQRILISLADTIFGAGDGTFTRGRPGIGFVNATFTLAAVPLPAALPLGLIGLGLLGFAARQRKGRGAGVPATLA